MKVVVGLIYILVGNVPEISSIVQNFTCENGERIPMTQFCDGTYNCDGSDEFYISNSLHSLFNIMHKINCSINGLTCLIDYKYICNRSVSCPGIDPCNVGCPDYYRCQNGDCMLRSTVCDGNSCEGCEEDDEWETGIGFKCVRNGRRCRIPQQLLHDGIQDCDQGEDLCYTFPNSTTKRTLSKDIRSTFPSNFDASRCFECLDGSMIIPRDEVCDHVIDCSDLSDECLCEDYVPSICNDVISRSLALTSPGYESVCEVGEIICGNGTCIDRSSVCNSIGDCPGNEDEKFGYCGSTLLCKLGLPQDQGNPCRCINHRCKRTTGIICDGIGDCPTRRPRSKWKIKPGFPQDECDSSCANTNSFNCTKSWTESKGSSLSFMSCNFTVWPSSESGLSEPITETRMVWSYRYCNGIPDCNVNHEDEVPRICPDRFHCRSGVLVNIPMSEVCDGTIDCDDGSDENKTICPDRFYCKALNGAKVSIDKKYICDGIVNCDDKEDEANCNDGRFYCENKQPFFVTSKQVFDGRGDCTDLSDECPIKSANKRENLFSSRYELIANPILRAMVWIMGILALTGNSVVIILEIKELHALREKNSSAPSRTNHCLILNLALADLLMGIYLIMLGIAGGVYSGRFCAYDISWRSGVTCKLMGVLVVLSSEASVMIMLLMASFRLFAVLKPFTALKQPSALTLVILITMTWTASFLMAFLPFSPSLQYIFTDQAVIQHNPFFRNVVVSFDSAKNWTERLLTFEPGLANASAELVHQIRGATTWNGLHSTLGNISIAELIQPSGSLGYYSVNSVCIPRLFVTRSDKSWRFSIAIIIFNFLAFVGVAAIYIIIIIKTRMTQVANRNVFGSKPQEDKKLKTMQKKIYRLMATDFCCWIPITIMALINFSGTRVPDIAYVISAIVLLPINSALNPILYSDVSDKLIQLLTQTLRNRHEMIRLMSSESAKDGSSHASTNT